MLIPLFFPEKCSSFFQALLKNIPLSKNILDEVLPPMVPAQDRSLRACGCSVTPCRCAMVYTEGGRIKLRFVLWMLITLAGVQSERGCVIRERFFFLRKVSPELTAANPPLFAEEDWPWASIHAHPPLLYVWDACHSMACQAAPCPNPGSEPAIPGRGSGTRKLNRYATGLAPRKIFFRASRDSTNVVPGASPQMLLLDCKLSGWWTKTQPLAGPSVSYPVVLHYVYPSSSSFSSHFLKIFLELVPKL